MVSPVTAADLSRFKTQRVGAGTFGAKTTELDKFKTMCETLGKDRLERAGLIIPPHVSFSIDHFMPALMRMGICNSHGEFVPNPSSAIDIEEGVIGVLEREHPEAREIIEAAAQFTGHPIAIRSDERSAKGIGAFKTFMKMYSGNAPVSEGYEKDEYHLLARIVDILCLQFAPVPMAFKEKVGMPHGIGIMIMPLVGDIIENSGSTLVYPKLSLSGFTAREQNKIMVSFGFGIGGGVEQEAGQIIESKEKRVSYNPNWQQEMKVFNLTQKSTEIIPGDSFMLSTCGLLPDMGVIDEATLKVAHTMLEIAKEQGIDFYWEAQSMDLEARIFAVTQVSEHVWPNVEKPSGKELLTFGPGNNGVIIGSGVVRCNGIVRKPVLPDDEEVTDASLELAMPTNSLVIGPAMQRNEINVIGAIDISIDSFLLYCNAGAILNSDLDHNKQLNAHVSGIYREAGIPILSPLIDQPLLEKIVPLADAIQLAQIHTIKAEERNNAIRRVRTELMRNKEVIVWADELNQTGGVVAP